MLLGTSGNGRMTQYSASNSTKKLVCYFDVKDPMSDRFSLSLVATVTSDDVGPGLLCLPYRFRLMFYVRYALRQSVVFVVETVFVFGKVINWF